jgi:sugar phosphate isomerase/epimerase
LNHALSTHLLVNHRLNTIGLERIRDTGIPAVEIFCARQHLDYRNKAQLDELAYWFRDSELKLHSLHAPLFSDDCWGRTGPSSIINIVGPDKIKRKASVDEIKRALEIAESIPFRYLIQHLGVPGEEYSDRAIEAGFSSLEELNVFASQRGVEVLLENIPNQLSSAERLLLFLNETHLDNNFCFDTGHAHMMEGIPSAFERMKNRIRSTHIHDNDGAADSHLFPFTPPGSIDWHATMQLLRSRQEQYPLLLELRDGPAIEAPLASAAAVFEKLENL